MVRPRLLDLFAGAGGAARGYKQAGFHVAGVDIARQPRYVGDEFHQADALTVLAHLVDCGPSCDAFPWLRSIRAIHASPPCQHYSDLAHRNGNAHEWPDLIPEVRALLEATGLPYVIENVEGAPLRDPVMLCGTMFPGLRVIRHRLFESNLELVPPGHGPHPLVYTRDKRKAHYGRLDQDTAFVSVNGGGNCSVRNKRAAMGIDWPMTGAEANEAIPPAYTRHIGEQLLARLRVVA